MLFVNFAKFAKNYRSSKYVDVAFEQWIKKLKNDTSIKN
jgi:hypothetical protein